MRVICRTVAAAACLSSLALTYAGQVNAAPYCDPTTSDGYLACIGGGIPWQNQNGSSPDTYGPTGERGFIYDNRSVGAFPGISDPDLLKIGYFLCEKVAEGYSDEGIKLALMDYGVDELNAGAIVTSAQMYLC